MGGTSLNEKQWIFPSNEPGKLGERYIMAACLRIVVKLVFETHCYSFDGKTYLQDDGGPIGLRFTNHVAKIRMNIWAKQVRKVLSNNKVNVYFSKSYVVE